VLGQWLGVVKLKNRGGSPSLNAVRMLFCPVVVAERCATWPSAVATVARASSGERA